MKARQPRSYAWARHLEASEVDPDGLSAEAQAGLELAILLAEDAWERSRDPQRSSQLEPLIIDQLAYEHDLPAETITRWIALARRKLFGKLSDAAIYKRVQRQRLRRPRTCAEPGCTTLIPITKPANNRYCPPHASGKGRSRRYRRKSE